VKICFNKLILRISKFNWVPLLLTQITIGIVFAESGWGKLHNLPKVIEFFRSLNIPAPELQAPMVAGLELVCGVLVFVGLMSRIAALPLIGTMVVAVITAKLPEFESWTDLFGASEFLYIILLLFLVTNGPSCISIDKLIRSKLSRPTL
jgi:putative oxidoreductase